MTDIPHQALWVRMPRFIGDGILISQSIEPLRQAGIPLVAWGAERVVDLYRGSNAFSAVHPDERSGRGAFALAGVLRRHSASGVIGFTRSLRPLAAGWLARVPLRIGWADRGGWLLATHSAPFWTVSLHHLDRYQQLMAKAYPGLDLALSPRPFRPRAEAEAAARDKLARAGLAQGFVACALGAHHWNKRLGPGPWEGVLHGLTARGFPSVLLGHGAEDQQLANELVLRGARTTNLVDALDLAETAAALALARGLVGNDSALAHLAAWVGCPAVIAFGPTRPDWTAPKAAAVRIARREDLPCLACGGHDCRTVGHPCMQELPSERILDGLDALLRPDPTP